MIGTIISFAIAPLILFPLGMFLLGKFSYKQVPISRIGGWICIALGFVIPLVVLIVQLNSH